LNAHIIDYLVKKLTETQRLAVLKEIYLEIACQTEEVELQEFV
jgi:hypothetical protein